MLVWAHFTPDPYQMPYVCFCRPAGYPQGQAVPTSESLPPPAAHLQGHEQPPHGLFPHPGAAWWYLTTLTRDTSRARRC